MEVSFAAVWTSAGWGGEAVGFCPGARGCKCAKGWDAPRPWGAIKCDIYSQKQEILQKKSMLALDCVILEGPFQLN